MTSSAIVEALRALGVTEDVSEPARERLLVALRRRWVEDKAMPSLVSLARELGIGAATVSKCLDTLRNEGRVLFVRRGVWVPTPEP